jgi:hypothetical protein
MNLSNIKQNYSQRTELRVSDVREIFKNVSTKYSEQDHIISGLFHAAICWFLIGFVESLALASCCSLATTTNFKVITTACAFVYGTGIHLSNIYGQNLKFQQSLIYLQPYKDSEIVDAKCLAYLLENLDNNFRLEILSRIKLRQLEETIEWVKDTALCKELKDTQDIIISVIKEPLNDKNNLAAIQRLFNEVVENGFQKNSTLRECERAFENLLNDVIEQFFIQKLDSSNVEKILVIARETNNQSLLNTCNEYADTSKCIVHI